MHPLSGMTTNVFVDEIYPTRYGNDRKQYKFPTGLTFFDVPANGAWYIYIYTRIDGVTVVYTNVYY